VPSRAMPLRTMPELERRRMKVGEGFAHAIKVVAAVYVVVVVAVRVVSTVAEGTARVVVLGLAPMQEQALE